jgi:hypothetical protein
LSSPPIDGRRGASVARSNFDRCVDKSPSGDFRPDCIVF